MRTRAHRQTATILSTPLIEAFTCEYYFSHYFAGASLILTRFKLLYDDWRGYRIALFAALMVANLYMSIYNHLRLNIEHEQVQIHAEQQETLTRERKAA